MPVPDLPLASRRAILVHSEGWFGRAPKAFQDAVLGRCEWQACGAGQPVYHAARGQADLFGIADGTVEFYSRFGTGDNPLLHLLHEGAWMGHGVLVSGQPPRATIVARTNTLLARVPRRAMLDLLAARPEWWRVLATAVMEYGDLAVSALADVLIPDHDRRCACTLLRLAGLRSPRRSRPNLREVPVTQDELAALVKLSRSTLVQVLRRLERRGLVAQGYRTLRVVDVAGLEAVAAGR